MIFNDKVFAPVTAKDVKEDMQLILEHGKPMIFGKEKNKGIVLEGLKLKVVTIGEDGVTEDDILVHDAHEQDSTLHSMLAKMTGPDFPMAMGVIRAVEASTFNDRIVDQIDEVEKTSSFKNMNDLLASGDTWEVN